MVFSIFFVNGAGIMLIFAHRLFFFTKVKKLGARRLKLVITLDPKRAKTARCRTRPITA